MTQRLQHILEIVGLIAVIGGIALSSWPLALIAGGLAVIILAQIFRGKGEP
jgi:hypothetical protein